MITLYNIYSKETVTLELVSEKFTFQWIWVVIFQGKEEMLTNSMGWSKVA